jgi:hypothetical protein
MIESDYVSRWLEAGLGCGSVATFQRRIITSAPIFNKLRGWEFDRRPVHFIYEKLGDESEDSLQFLTRPPSQLDTAAEAAPQIRRLKQSR